METACSILTRLCDTHHLFAYKLHADHLHYKLDDLIAITVPRVARSSTDHSLVSLDLFVACFLRRFVAHITAADLGAAIQDMTAYHIELPPLPRSPPKVDSETIRVFRGQEYMDAEWLRSQDAWAKLAKLPIKKDKHHHSFIPLGTLLCLLFACHNLNQ